MLLEDEIACGAKFAVSAGFQKDKYEQDLVSFGSVGCQSFFSVCLGADSRRRIHANSEIYRNGRCREPLCVVF